MKKKKLTRPRKTMVREESKEERRKERKENKEERRDERGRQKIEKNVRIKGLKK